VAYGPGGQIAATQHHFRLPSGNCRHDLPPTAADRYNLTQAGNSSRWRPVAAEVPLLPGAELCGLGQESRSMEDPRAHYSALMLAARITLPYLSVSSAMNFHRLRTSGFDDLGPVARGNLAIAGEL
jgi:hypothetical protein